MKVHTTLAAMLLFGGRLLAHDVSESENRHSHAPSWHAMHGTRAQEKLEKQGTPTQQGAL